MDTEKIYAPTPFAKRFRPYLKEIMSLDIPYGVKMMEYIKPIVDAPEEEQAALQEVLLARAKSLYPPREKNDA